MQREKLTSTYTLTSYRKIQMTTLKQQKRDKTMKTRQRERHSRSYKGKFLTLV
jgi:hypothetical protein